MTTADMREFLEQSIEESETGCWLWTGQQRHGGYGRLRVGGRDEYAHRVSYRTYVGPIPDGLVIDHLCRQPGCVRPSHLEPVSFRENVLRGTGVTATNARKDRCPVGHAYAPDNLRAMPDGKRACKTCHRVRERAARNRRRQGVGVSDA